MTVFRNAYQESDFFIPEATLIFDLSLTETRVRSTLQVKRNTNRPLSPLCLQGEALELISVKVNDKILAQDEYRFEQENLVLDLIDDTSIIEIENRISPEKNTTLSGLYASNGALITQCEAEGFRRITYFLDRPDVLTRFNVILRAPEKQFEHLLSNGDLVSEKIEEGIKIAHWHDPFPKSCYLFALVAGHFFVDQSVFITRSGRRVSLKIFVEAENKGKTQYAMQSLKNAMQFDEHYYDREYDLKNYFIVAVNDFNMGAMENKGLNIFNAKYILADENIATDADYQNVARVVAHEYFHNWRGNRVCPRSWFELSYKEGFTVFTEQDFVEHYFDPALARLSEVRTLISEQFREDQSPLCHAVRPDSYEKIDNFYTHTIYEKGAEVVRMIKTLVGPDVFKEALNEFFKTFDGDSVTIDEFIKTIELVAKQNLRQFKLWYSESGTPVLNVKRTYDERYQTLKLTFTQGWPQNTQGADKPDMLIPISLRLINDDKTHDPKVVILSKHEMDVVFNDVSKNALPSLLRDFSAPVVLKHDFTLTEMGVLAEKDDNPFNRANALKYLLIEWIHALETGEQTDQLESISLIALKAALKDSFLSEGMRAMLLSLPTFNECGISYSPYDPHKRVHAIETVEKKIAETFKAEFEERVKTHPADIAKDLSQRAVGERMGYAVALRYLGSVGTEETAKHFFDLLKQTVNQTDFESLVCGVLKTNTQAAKETIRYLEEKWQAHPLLFNKWLSYQAVRPFVTVADLKKLATHAQFDLKNPNNVYSLFNTFAARNPSAFHAESGEGYALFTDILKEVEKLNPQVAARLVESLSVKQVVLEPYQSRLNAVIQELNQSVESEQVKERLACLLK